MKKQFLFKNNLLPEDLTKALSKIMSMNCKLSMESSQCEFIVIKPFRLMNKNKEVILQATENDKFVLIYEFTKEELEKTKQYFDEWKLISKSQMPVDIDKCPEYHRAFIDIGVNAPKEDFVKYWENH